MPRGGKRTKTATPPLHMPAPAHTAVRLGLESPVSVEVERVFTRSERTIVTNPWDSSIDLITNSGMQVQAIGLASFFRYLFCNTRFGSVLP